MRQESSNARIRFAASVIGTVAMVGAAIALCWTVYASIQGNLFDLTASGTLDTLDVVRDLGVESVDTQLRSAKTDVKSAVSEHGAELAAALEGASDGLSSVSRVLSGIGLSAYGKDFWLLTTEGLLIGPDGSQPSWSAVMPPADATDIAQANAAEVVGPGHNDEGAYVMALSAPLVVQGEMRGTLIERFDGYCVSAWISDLSFELGGGVTYLVDGTGRNIAASREENYDWFETEYNATELAAQGDAEAAEVAAVEGSALAGETGRGSYGWGDGRSYMSYGPLTEADWGIFVGFYGNELETHVESIVAQSAGVAQVCVALLVVLLGVVAIASVRGLSRQRAANERLFEQKLKIEQQAEALMASEARFGVALEKTGNMVFDYDIASGDIQCFTTPEDARRCSATAENLRTALVAQGEVEDESLKLFCDALDDVRHGAQRVECMLEVREPSGEKLWFRASLSALASADGSPLRAIGVLEDVTKEREGEYDSLTGLLDRKAAFETARAALDAAGADDGFAFVMMDVDRFKGINDTYGHPAGDEVLRWVARVLVESFGEDDVVARYGGDEFCVFCDADVRAERLKAAMDRVNARLAESAESRGAADALSCSFGVTMRKGTRLSFESMQAEADKALYAAKRAGRRAWAFYAES